MDKDQIMRGLPRRQFLKNIGSLTVGFSLLPFSLTANDSFGLAPELPGSLRRYTNIDAWLQILEDNRVRVFTGKIELGQGIGIVIKQVAAEELCCDLDLVEVVLADTGLTPNEGYTAGSGSVKASAMAVRYAAAAAREKLIELAAQQSGIAGDELVLQEGVIQDKRGKISLSISALLSRKRFETEVTMPVKLKPKEQYRYVGKSVPGEQLDQSITGKSYFINDLKFPGMLHARMLKPPTYTAVLINADPEVLKRSLPDSIEMFINGSFVAVLGKEEWVVANAAEALSKKLTWELPDQLPVETALKDYMVSSSTNVEQVLDTGTIDKTGLQIFEGSFYKPYIMHGSMGPACGIAYYDGNHLQVWSHSQGVFPLRAALSSMTQVPEEDIRVTGVPGAGCFGHNCSDDAAAEAVIIAMTRRGKHIKVQWSRKDEHKWEALGSAMRMDVSAGLSKTGHIAFWKSDVWSDSHSVRPNSDAGTLLPARYLQNPFVLKERGYLGGGYRNADPYYTIPTKQIQAHFFDGPLRVSSLRSLGAYANIFAIESIVEGMAYRMKMNPIDFRILNLEDVRAIEVLKKLKEITGNAVMADREGIGYSFSRYKNSDGYCAVATHLKIDGNEKVQLITMWAVVDAGEIMNPDGLKKQTEGGMLQAASWTLFEEVKFDKNHITSDDWIRYPMMHMRDAPNVRVELFDRPDEPALGGGEMAVPPTPAAITNAIYRATGKRIYDLPVKLSGR
ncbi:MAG: xanthine dehydrogenase family protein molybdopterin-binding subunit [Saprospiraceae bacterium]|nr:xanthine dehydrogenase family protein molybdopterin-binding subunit [Saprospiraceae bacterium]